MHVIKVCVGCSCVMNFGVENVKKAEEVLGIKAGETSADGQFKLEAVGCIGNCESAPNVMFLRPEGPLAAVMVDGHIEKNVLPNRFGKMLKELK
ncbi:MAG: NAD(P)H-dependent oxidoreductase subunit E, partial [Patescibacteria group bacterium]